MAEPGKPAIPPPISPPAAAPQQLPLPGVPQPAMLLQGRFVAAAQYASVLLQMLPQIFPGQPWLALTDDQRRVLFDETSNVLTRSKWVIESKAFADKFALQPQGVEMAPPGTVLGDPVPNPATAAKVPGQYL
jgi:hypothetical protein